MNIRKENIDELNAVITIELSKADYYDTIEKKLKDYKKKASMPGFRPGMVPMGMIKKMYEKPIAAEEINTILSDKLNGFIKEQNIDLLGSPMIQENSKIDLEVLGDIAVSYDIAFAPAFTVDLSSKDKFNQYQITIDAPLIEKYVEDLTRRYGEMSDSEVATDKDMLTGTFAEVDAKGNVVEGGITNTSTISIEFLEDKKAQKSLVGLKVGDSLVLDPTKVSKGTVDMAAMLNITSEAAEGLKSQFLFTVEKIHSMKPAELNQDFFDKLFGKDVVKSEEEFREKLQSELTTMLSRDSEAFLVKEIKETLMKRFDLKLPDQFLRKWLLATNEKLTAADLEKDYENYANSLRWQLIENNIIKENNVKVEPQDVVAYAKSLIKKQYEQYGLPDIDDSILDNSAKDLLKNEEQVKNLYQQLYSEKLTNLYKSTFTLKTKEVTFDEFVNLATGKPSKSRFLENLSNLVKL